MSVTWPDGSSTDEEVVTRFLNSDFRWQVVTDGPDARCPRCAYPERHRVYDVDVATATLIADGCPACETSRIRRRNPVIVAYREQLARHPLTVSAGSWLSAIDALAAFGGYTLWDHPDNVFHVLTRATPQDIDHARRVFERLAWL